MYFIRKGYKAYDGRLRAMFIIAMFPLAILAAQPLGAYSFWFPVILIGIGAAAHQAWSANIFTTVSDMFPKKAIGSVVGIGGMAGGLGGVVMSKLGGALFDHYKALGHIETGYTIMINAASHPQFILIQGTVSGASMAPTFVPELKMPVAKDRSFLGKYSAVAFIAAGKLPASPKANKARENIKPKTETEKPAMPAQPSDVEIPLPMGIANA